MEDPDDLHKAAGCVIKNSDFANVVYSVTYFAIFAAYGAAAAALGAALPSLAATFGKSVTEFGFVFTARAVGFLIGTFGSAVILNWKGAFLSKHISTCLALCLSGIASGVIEMVDSYEIAISAYIVQGVGFGCMDTVANCALPEIWDRRVGPWMQAMHSCFGVGAIIGPALVGAIGYHAAYVFICWFSFAPLVGLWLFYLWQATFQSTSSTFTPSQGHQKLSTSDEEDNLSTEPNSSTDTSLDKNNVHSPNEDEAGRDESTNKIPIPMYLRILVSAFFFTYVGSETGFGGWVPAYSIATNITQDEAQAAYLSAIFWGTMTIGRITAIPAAVYISSTTLIRLQLALSVFSGLLILTVLSYSYLWACIISAFAGFAFSSIFPVMITIIGDYGFEMDTLSTTMYMIGATAGESILPVVIGFAMGIAGAYSMPFIVFLCTLILLLLYCVVHWLSMYNVKQWKLQHLQEEIHSSLTDSSHPLNTFRIVSEEDDEDDDENGEKDVHEKQDSDHDSEEGLEMVHFNPLTSHKNYLNSHPHHKQYLQYSQLGRSRSEDSNGADLVKVTEFDVFSSASRD